MDLSKTPPLMASPKLNTPLITILNQKLNPHIRVEITLRPYLFHGFEAWERKTVTFSMFGKYKEGKIIPPTRENRWEIDYIHPL